LKNHFIFCRAVFNYISRYNNSISIKEIYDLSEKERNLDVLNNYINDNEKFLYKLGKRIDRLRKLNIILNKIKLKPRKIYQNYLD
jgi:hypothetical protein